MTTIRMAGQQSDMAFWLMTPNDDACEISAMLGYSNVIIDMEHGSFDQASAARMITLCKSLQFRVFTRVASAERVPIQHALDFGSDGVILPQITDLAHAEQVTSYAKYPPLGTRGFGGGKMVSYLPTPRHFVEAENRRVSCWAMIETTSALPDVEKIAALAMVDGLFIGPNDLSLALGKGEYTADGSDHDDITRIAKAALAANKPWAMPIASHEDRDLAISLDIEFMAITDERTAMRDGLEARLRDLEKV